MAPSTEVARHASLAPAPVGPVQRPGHVIRNHAVENLRRCQSLMPVYGDSGCVPKRTTCRGTACRSPAPVTRRHSYRGDKLSRIALPFGLVECHSHCVIRSLAEGRTRGAHVAGRLVYFLSEIKFGLLTLQTPYEAILVLFLSSRLRLALG